MATDAAKRQMTKMTGLGLAESIIYEHDGEERQLTAMIDRSPPEPVMHGATADIAVTLLVDDELGVSSPAAVDKGTDRLKIAERRGGEAAWRNIDRVAETADPDFLKLEIA